MNRKQSLFLLVFTISIAGALSAQESKNWVSGEVSVLGAGARYERMLNDKFSVGGTAFFNTLSPGWSSYKAFIAAGRWYPFTGVFYAEIGLGFGQMQITEHETNRYGNDVVTGEYYNVNGLMLTPTIGWKIDLGKPGALYINPMVGLPILLFGSEPGGFLRAAFGAGYAF